MPGKTIISKIGGPCGLFSAVAALLVVGDLATSADLNQILAWYLLIAGVAYAGRLPIHIFGPKYPVLRPSQHPKSKLRKRLNFLTSLNALSVCVWAAVVWFLFTQPPAPLLLQSGLGIVFYGLVMWLAMETVACAGALELPRGTEWLCDSAFGQRFKSLRSRAPKGSPMRGGMDIFVEHKTPKHQASWFVALAAAALLAPATAANSAKLVEKVLHQNAAVAVGKAVAVSAPPPGASGAAAPTAEDPTYEEECGDALVPGAPAPSPWREQLRALWLGGGGIDGDGGREAGCARPAFEVPDQRDVWVAPSYCGPELRGLGVTAPNYLPAMLFQQAAGFALAKAREGELRGASSRWRRGGGDGYVVDTDAGSFVLVRRDASGGDVEPSGELPCESFEEANVPYVVVPPGLLGLWQEVNQGGWTWPVASSEDPDGFAFQSRDGEVVTTAHCYTDTRCAAWIAGALQPTTGSLFTSVSVLLSSTE